MSLIKVWVHLVWSTKLRVPFLVDEIRQDIFSHIQGNAFEKNIELLCINGYLDHTHCLIRLKSSQSIMDIANLIKGESSFWINKNGLISNGKFQWQKEYYAESIGQRNLPRLEKYIANQEQHHKKNSLIEIFETIVPD